MESEKTRDVKKDFCAFDNFYADINFLKKFESLLS